MKNIGEDVKTKKTLLQLVGMEIGRQLEVANSMGVPQIEPKQNYCMMKNSALGIYLKKMNENTNLKRTMHPKVHSSITKIMEATKCLSTDKQ